MSSNPFGDVPPNPYAPSAYTPGGGYGTLPPDKDYAKARLQIPAIVLIALAALTAILRIGGIVLLLAGIGARNAEGAMFVGQLVGHGVPLLLLIAVIVGCFKMLNVESYGSAMTAAIISVVPFCSPGLILGIPFGIWAIVVLNDPRVKGAFR